MKTFPSIQFIVLSLALAVAYRPEGRAQEASAGNRVIEFPGIPGYLTLKCDLHMHTVLSDGHVWPTLRFEEALKDGLDNNLATLGTSDIHGLIDWQFDVPVGGHRPVTLVFAREKTEGSMKEALRDRRTAVWLDNTLVGIEQFLCAETCHREHLRCSLYPGKPFGIHLSRPCFGHST